MNPDRLWLRFVRLALICALVPGFGLAAWMTGAWWFALPRGWCYLASLQIHSVALMMGWGGAMILGVALHFLPRLRAVKLHRPEWAAALFGGLALGLVLRMVGQWWLAALAPAGPAGKVRWLNAVVAGGVGAQTIGVVGLLLLLTITFRSGRPLKQNEGFRQILPLLGVAGIALLLAQLAWCVATVEPLVTGATLALLASRPSWLAADLMLFGFIAAVSIGMSARLFPLTFRTKLASSPGLQSAAGLLALGLIFTLLEAARSALSGSSPAFTGGAALCRAGGLGCGIFAVRIFHPRKPTSHPAAPYRLWEDPAAIGVVCAYVWCLMAALFLLLIALQQFGLPIPPSLGQNNLPRHALGAGFMTLLILSVGWKMLPGFGGGRPRARGLMWSALLLANLATLLRIVPALFSPEDFSGVNWTDRLFPVAGLCGWGAIAAFAVALRASLRRPKAVTV
ncbi:MAG TPA: hypothetical protein PKN95_05640 [Verrucomicrobiota bacterium]|nr:hypothetical protein [Verrucomicrobiota bacterium]HNT15380.1 hypothetical protein [Verrucomicrobiota bacterium]